MAEGKICVCPQCGKKFKLKPEFSAASFACTGCSATVWAEGEPTSKATPKARRAGAATRARRGGKRLPAPRKGKAQGGGRERSRGRREEAEAEADERPRSRYSNQGNNSTNMIIAVVGVLIVVGGILFFALGNKDDKAKTEQANQADASNPGGGDTAMKAGADQNGPTGTEDAGNGEGTKDEGLPPVEGGSDGEPKKAAGTDGDDSTEPSKTDPDKTEPAKPLKKIGGTTGKGKRKRGDRNNRYYPPADLGHLKDTAPELRAKIDKLVDQVFDPFAGRDSGRAKTKLAAIGKPAFLPILGRMRRERDKLKDDGSHDELQVEASIRIADTTLRMMDGHLDGKGKQPIRPGTQNDYIDRILLMHYRRWVKDLHKLETMPGPFVASYDDKDEDE